MAASVECGVGVPSSSSSSSCSELNETIVNAKKTLDYCLCNKFTLAETFAKQL